MVFTGFSKGHPFSGQRGSVSEPLGSDERCGQVDEQQGGDRRGQIDHGAIPSRCGRRLA
jgi:hypothetical protein